MNSKMRTKMNSKIINKIIFMVVFVAFGFSGSAFAKMNSVEGTITGANCAVYNKMCPVENEAHLALEPDFVLLQDD